MPVRKGEVGGEPRELDSRKERDPEGKGARLGYECRKGY